MFFLNETKNSVPQLSIYSPETECAFQIASLYAKLFDPLWSQEFIRGLIDKTTTVPLVASLENKHEIVGFLLGSLAADEGEILSLGVDVQYQRLGIASELLSAFLKKLKDESVKRVFLEVGVDNIAAKMLYKKYGFEVVGRRKKYYERSMGSFIDAMIMSLSL